MENEKKYVRRNINLSHYVDKMIADEADRIFSGNISAFIAHTALFYVRCQHCEAFQKIKVDVGRLDVANFKGQNNGVVTQNSRVSD